MNKLQQELEQRIKELERLPMDKFNKAFGLGKYEFLGIKNGDLYKTLKEYLAYVIEKVEKEIESFAKTFPPFYSDEVAKELKERIFNNEYP